MSQQDNLKALYKQNNEEQIDDYMLNDTIEDGETYRYIQHNSTKEVMVQNLYVGALSPVRAHIFDKPYSMINNNNAGTMEATYDGKYSIPVYIDNGSTINIMPTTFYNKAKFLHHLPKYDATGENHLNGKWSDNNSFLDRHSSPNSRNHIAIKIAYLCYTCRHGDPVERNGIRTT